MDSEKAGRFDCYGALVATVCLSVVMFLSLQQDPNKGDKMDSFACAINCMDGRVQDAVKDYMRNKYRVRHVDMATEPGPCKILAVNDDKSVVENIKKRAGISVHHHGTTLIAIVAHEECAGNPVGKEEQIQHLRQAQKTVESFGLGDGIEVILLWVNPDWKTVEEISIN